MQDRRGDALGQAAGHTQTMRGSFFEQLADLTDDDGALTELEDGDEWDAL